MLGDSVAEKLKFVCEKTDEKNIIQFFVFVKCVLQKILAEIQEEKPRSTNPVGSASRVLFAASNTAVLARARLRAELAG